MDAQFDQWWNTAKLWSEFRGVSMPAALAAWLAGKKSVEGITRFEISNSSSGGTENAAPPAVVIGTIEPPKKVGKYAAEGRNVKRQSKESEQEKVDAST